MAISPKPRRANQFQVFLRNNRRRRIRDYVPVFPAKRKALNFFQIVVFKLFNLSRLKIVYTLIWQTASMLLIPKFAGAKRQHVPQQKVQIFLRFSLYEISRFHSPRHVLGRGTRLLTIHNEADYVGVTFINSLSGFRVINPFDFCI